MLGVGEGSVVFGWRGLSTPKHAPLTLQQKGQLNTCHLPRTVQKQQKMHLVIMLCYSVNPRKVKIS